MKASYDPKADAVYLGFGAGKPARTEEVRPGVVFDFDESGRIIGIEILDASRTLAGDPQDIVSKPGCG